MASLPTTPPHLPPSNVEGDGSSSRSNSPDGNCPICLGKVNNKAFTDACFHTFCFVCLLEWSKIRATCPLCKTSFKSIIHNVVSNDVYDRYHLKPTNTGSFGEDGRGRRFRYSTTMTEEHRYEMTLRRNRALERRHQRAHQAHLQAANEERRRMIYRAGLWVRHMGSNRFTRFRDISPEFFRENPATTHRLVPWLRRELNILFSGEDHVTFMTQYILSLIPNVHMQTEEFHEHLRPFLYAQTEHFIHEFVSFSRSPYDMTTYDQIAQYDLTAANPQLQPTLSRPLSPPQRILHVDYNDVITLSSDDDVVEVHDIPTLRSLLQSDSDSSSPSQAASEQVEALDLSSTHNPEPPASYQYDQDQPGPSGISGGPTVQVKSEHESGQENVISDDSSDIEIVGFVKPFDERTPECLIVLTSSTEEDEETQRLQSRHVSKGEGKRHQKKKHIAEAGSKQRLQEASHHEGRSSNGGKTHRHSHKKKHKHHKHRTHRKSHRHHSSRQEEPTSHSQKHSKRSRSRSRSKSTCSSSSHLTVRSKVVKPRPEEHLEYRGSRGSSSSSQTHHRSHSRSRPVQEVEQLHSRDTRERDRASNLPEGSQQKVKSSQGHSWKLHWRNKDRDNASRSRTEQRDHSRSTAQAEDAATITQHSQDQHYQSTMSRKHRASDDDRSGRERSKIRRTDDSGPHLMTMVISRKKDTHERSSSSNDVVSTKSSHGHRRKHKKHKRHKRSHTAKSSQLRTSPVPYAHHNNVYSIEDDANDGDRSSDSTEEETDSFM